MEDSIQSDSRRGRNGDGNDCHCCHFLRALKSGVGCLPLANPPATSNESSALPVLPDLLNGIGKIFDQGSIDPFRGGGGGGAESEYEKSLASKLFEVMEKSRLGRRQLAEDSEERGGRWIAARFGSRPPGARRGSRDAPFHSPTADIASTLPLPLPKISHSQTPRALDGLQTYLLLPCPISRPEEESPAPTCRLLSVFFSAPPTPSKISQRTGEDGSFSNALRSIPRQWDNGRRNPRGA